MHPSRSDDRPLWRQRGPVVLLLNTLLMYGGFYMLVPFVAVHGTRDLGLDGTAVGLVLSLRILTQQSLMVFGGALGDRLGHKPILAAGMLVRAFGFVTFGLVDTLPGLFAAALLSALGGAPFESTGKAALTAMVTPEERMPAFSLYSVAGQVGTALGPLIGAALLQASFTAVSYGASACFFVAFFMIVALLPLSHPAPSQQTARRQAPAVRQMLITVTGHRSFVVLTALTLGYWFVFVQFTLSLPLYINRQFGNTALLGPLYAFYAVLAILLQMPLIAWISRRLSSARIMALGSALIAVAWALLPLSGNLALLFTAVALIALGDMLVQPTTNSLVARIARPGALASFFGFSALALAFGGGLGNALGGALFDLFSASGFPLLPWLIYAAIAAGTAFGLALYARAQTQPEL